ncbi:hypothetical protein HUN58_02295 [Curtobacterium sp. Csp1]|uniref:hypothetical protein n=1 Tax=Curtobacterium sp. Csp1 TaxID=2495429 RepID=UPI001598F95E|nr:hypothetical protein [Curtobacterium sp. Csp1]QKS18889.1 hypothetical protein HUN58_02295 [Curtobacterium sp. Csp1]
MTTKLVRWAVETAALPLDTSILFDSATIDEFAHVGLVTYSTSGRSTMRSKLRAVARAVRDEPDDPDEFKIPRSSPVSPYTDSEQAALESWARGQHSDDRRTSAGALLALGLGAGLTGREIVAARRADISHDADGFIVHVHGAAERTVPVLYVWEHLLQERAGTADGWLFRSGQAGGNPNLITDFVSRSHQRLTVQARRLRATWLVHHLTIGTPLPTLLPAAGLQSAEALDRLLPFVGPPDSAQQRALLRDARDA